MLSDDNFNIKLINIERKQSGSSDNVQEHTPLRYYKLTGTISESDNFFAIGMSISYLLALVVVFLIAFF